MKNIILLPTDKPSRLIRIYSDAEKNNFSLKLDSDVNDCFKEYVNIYITSDEKPKVGDWCISTEGIWKNTIALVEEKPITDVWKKIILTTDKLLNKFGIQSVDYYFLEWFVKNPTCEKVDIECYEVDKEWDEVHTKFNPIYPNKTKHKIIIPKEKIKTGSLSEAILDVIDKQLGEIKQIEKVTELSEIEQLKKVAENRYVQGVYVINGIDICEASRECFIEGAKYRLNIHKEIEYKLKKIVLSLLSKLNGGLHYTGIVDGLLEKEVELTNMLYEKHCISNELDEIIIKNFK